MGGGGGGGMIFDSSDVLTAVADAVSTSLFVNVVVERSWKRESGLYNTSEVTNESMLWLQSGRGKHDTPQCSRCS